MTFGLSIGSQSTDADEVALVSQAEDVGRATSTDTPKPSADSEHPTEDTSPTGYDTAKNEVSDVSATTEPHASMVIVPAGTYDIGCQGEDCNFQRPYETKKIHRRFGIMRHEVTTSDYLACVTKGACNKRKITRKPGCHTQASRYRQHPVNCVSFKEAKRYCEAQGKGWRLPSDAEWEIAARGKEQQPYPWGSAPASCDLTAMKNTQGGGCGIGGALAVGSKPKDRSWCGAFDLAGNVTEWTGSFNEDGAPYIRGASFMMGVGEFFDCSIRQAERPALTRPDIGFRCALDLD